MQSQPKKPWFFQAAHKSSKFLEWCSRVDNASNTVLMQICHQSSCINCKHRCGLTTLSVWTITSTHHWVEEGCEYLHRTMLVISDIARLQLSILKLGNLHALHAHYIFSLDDHVCHSSRQTSTTCYYCIGNIPDWWGSCKTAKGRREESLPLEMDGMLWSNQLQCVQID